MRFLTPSAFAFALLMLALPWLEIQCTQPQKMTLVRQNGFQTMTGDYSWGKDFKDMMKSMNQMQQQPGLGRPGGAGKQALPGPDLEKKEKLDPAYFVMAWAGLAALGIVLGFVLPLGRSRSFLLGTCGAVAAACLVVQAFVVKFPAFKDSPAKQAPGQNPRGAKLDLGDVDAPIKKSFEIGFWLALLATVGAVVVAAVEMAASPGDTRRRRRMDRRGDSEEPTGDLPPPDRW